MPKSAKPAKKRLVVEEQPEVVEPRAETEAAVVVTPAPAEAPAEPATAATTVAPVVVEPPPVETPAEVTPVTEVQADEEEVTEKKTMPKGLVFVLGLLFGGALGAGSVLGWNIYWYKMLKKDKPATVVMAPTPTTAVAEKITPTPTVALKRSDLKVRVENGGVVKGAATKGSDYLTGLGYEVVSTGNSALDVTTTQVSVVKSKMQYATLLLIDLGKKYQVASTASELTGSGDYDALVTVDK